MQQSLLEYPEISVEVLAISGHPNILTERLDLGIMVGHQLRLRDSSSWSRRVGTFPRHLYASAAYLEKRGAPENSSDLVKHLCIRLVHGGPLSQWELRRGREQKAVSVDGKVTAISVGMLAKLANEGLGITLLPDFLAVHAAFGDGLVRILGEWEGLPAHVFAITPTALQPVLAKTFVDAPGPAPKRLKDFVVALHRRKKDRLANDTELYPLYRRIVDERPELIQNYSKAMTKLVAAILADGVQRGEYKIMDVGAAAEVVRDAVTVFIHPVLVEAAAKAGMSMELSIQRVLATLNGAFKAGVLLP